MFDDGESYIVYEYSAGTSIEEVLRGGALSPVEAAWVVKELAQAMAALHSRGLYHERLGPDTVVITAAGNVRIVGLLVEAASTPLRRPTRVRRRTSGRWGRCCTRAWSPAGPAPTPTA